MSVREGAAAYARGQLALFDALGGSELIGLGDEAEARREGFADGAAFVAAFEAINGCYADPNAAVWRVEFKPVTPHQLTVDDALAAVA